MSSAREHAAVSTSLLIRKWDAEQAEWVLRRAADEAALARLRHGENVTVAPETFSLYGVEPYETWQQDDLNNIVQAGWVALLGGVAGTSITNKFSAANGRVGAGTSSAAVSYTQTALQGDTGGSSTTSYYKLVSGAPVISTGSSPPTLVFTSAFGTGVANFAWNEFGTDNFTADGVTATGLGAGVIFFNRGVAAMGSKAAGQIWTAVETISFGYPSGSGTVV